MKILVLVKETLATDARIKLETRKKINMVGVEYIINPYDFYAIEEAVRLKEQFGGEVILFTLGNRDSVANLKSCLAMGADRAVYLKSDLQDSRQVSEALAWAIAKEEEVDLILAGWKAVDDNNAQVPGRLSVILNLPFVNVVSDLKVDPLMSNAICQRDRDTCSERVLVSLPAIVAVQKGINEPRYPSVPGILQAKDKTIDVLIPETTPITGNVLSYQLPVSRRKCVFYDGSDPETSVELLIASLLGAKVL